MGISSQEIHAIGVSATQVLVELERIMTSRGRKAKRDAMTSRMRAPRSGADDLDRPRYRYFAVTERRAGWTAITEAGDFADRSLAVSLAKGLRKKVLVLMLSESVNAWGYLEIDEAGGLS
jgi:hypothetical protein